MGLKLTNNARSLLAVSISATDLIMRVRTGHGSRFPVLEEPDDWFPLALENELGEIEYLRCIGRSGDALTVRRGQESSQPRSYMMGDAIELRLTAGASNELMGTGTSGQPVMSLSQAYIEVRPEGA